MRHLSTVRKVLSTTGWSGGLIRMFFYYSLGLAPAKARRRHNHDRQYSPGGSPYGGEPLEVGPDYAPKGSPRVGGTENCRWGRIVGPPADILLWSQGRMSDVRGAFGTLGNPPKTKRLLGDKGYDADWF